MNRREWLTLGAASLAVGGAGEAQQAPAQASNQVLPLEQYQPKSMLHVPETHVPRARFPVIDFHTHITSGGRGDPNRIQLSMDPANCVAVMDRKNIQTMVSLTGGYSNALRDAVAKLPEAQPVAGESDFRTTSV